MPEADAYVRLSTAIAAIARRFHAPKFQPHVTLLGLCVGARTELLEKAAQVASTIRPFDIHLKAVGYLDEYFRCLFVHVATSEPLRMAHENACRVFGRHREPPFMPHLSLLYGNFSASLKQALISEFGTRLDLEFPVRSLHVYRTAAEPRTWRRVAQFDLQ
jgi:2'-5' RNA ligase